MEPTQRKRRGRTYTARTNKGLQGVNAERLDRMQRVWALRARGYSFRAIAKEVGVHPTTAWQDCQEAPDGVKLMDDTSIARSQLLHGHRILLNHLMSEIEEQREHGQRIVQRGADGKESVTIKPMDSKLIGEAGRCLDRAARLLGLLDGPIEGGGSNQTTFIQLTQPSSSGPSFEARYQQNAEPTTVDVTAAETSAEPSSSHQELPLAAALPDAMKTTADTQEGV